MMIENKQQMVEINGQLYMIDTGCVDLVMFFNKVGLATKYSCEGHLTSPYEIMFADNVSDEMIEDFLLKFENKYTHSPFLGRFLKWKRKMSGKIVDSWVYNCKGCTEARVDYETMKSKFNLK